MAFYTNFAGALSDGYSIPAGGEKQVVLRQILEGIVSETAGEWLECTSGAPTPVNLRAFASTVAAGVTNSATPAVGNQVTLYQANDPQIANGDGFSRLIRFEINNTIDVDDWITTSIMDTFVRDDLWASNPQTVGGLLTDNNMTSASAAATLTYNHRLFVFGDDDWLIVALFNTALGVMNGVLGFLFPNTVDGFDRDQLPYFWAWSAPPKYDAVQDSPNLWSAAGSAAAGATQAIMSHAANIMNTSILSDEGLQYAFARIEAFQVTTFFSHIMQIPRIRVVNASLFTSEFLQFTADSKTWLVLSCMDGVAVCLDITPDP